MSVHTDAPRLANGNFFVERKGGRNMDPLDPSRAFSPIQHERILDLITAATAPLLEQIRILAEKAGVEIPKVPQRARVLRTAKLADAPEPERPEKKKGRPPREKILASMTTEAEPAPDAPAVTAAAPAEAGPPLVILSQRAQQLLNSAQGPALKKQVKEILTADQPEEVRLARARALITKQGGVGSDTVPEE